MKTTLLLTSILALAFLAPARAELTARQVLDHALALQDQVQDYTAHCTLAVTMPDQQIPTRNFTVYYKRPDKLKIDSSQMVFVPREALTLGGLRRHLTADTEVSMAGVGTIGAYPLYCIKLRPRGDGPPVRLLTWIRGDYWLPTRTELWRGDTRVVNIAWAFAWTAGKYWMPTGLTATIPSGVLSASGGATLTLTWRDYLINTGLADDLFK
ncbi:MAG TPA: hypothetical protein VGM19_04940 [Armatimonadota bacterium]|jgi:hypothetical protein